MALKDLMSLMIAFAAIIISILTFAMSLSKSEAENRRIAFETIARLNDYISENETAGYCLEFSSKVKPEEMKVILQHQEGSEIDNLSIRAPYKKFALNCIQGDLIDRIQANGYSDDEALKLSKRELEFVKDQTFGLLNRYEELVLVATLRIGDACLIRKQQGRNLFNRKPDIMKVLELYKQATGYEKPPVPELVNFLSRSENIDC